jgi:uncharacterized membrane protein YuzA (DUF378 family)
MSISLTLFYIILGLAAFPTLLVAFSEVYNWLTYSPEKQQIHKERMGKLAAKTRSKRNLK